MVLFLVFDSIMGVPAHPLLVHAAVVMVPIAAVALAVTGWRASWRTSYSFPVAIMASAGAVFAFLAKQSGEPLKRSIETAARAAGVGTRLGDHPEQGDTAFIFSMFFGLAAIAFWAVDRYGDRIRLPKWSPWVVYGGAVLLGGFATVGMVIAGHSGATLVWNDVGTYAGSR